MAPPSQYNHPQQMNVPPHLQWQQQVAAQQQQAQQQQAQQQQAQVQQQQAQQQSTQAPSQGTNPSGPPSTQNRGGGPPQPRAGYMPMAGYAPSHMYPQTMVSQVGVGVQVQPPHAHPSQYTMGHGQVTMQPMGVMRYGTVMQQQQQAQAQQQQVASQQQAQGTSTLQAAAQRGRERKALVITVRFIYKDIIQ